MTLDRYAFGEITAERAMQYLGIDNLETLHLQMLDAEIPIPDLGVSLKYLINMGRM